MVEQLTEERTNPACAHHWMIQPPDGSVSQGVCLKCEEVREFCNYIETPPDWEVQPPAGSRKRT